MPVSTGPDARQLKPSCPATRPRYGTRSRRDFFLSGKMNGKALATRFSSVAPDIAVEVFSPSNTHAEMERKVAEYLAAGSQRVWLLPSRHSVVVHRADGATITYTGDDVDHRRGTAARLFASIADIFR